MLKPPIPLALDKSPHLTATGEKEGLDKVALVYTAVGASGIAGEDHVTGRWLVGGWCHVLLPEDDTRGSAFPRATILWAPPSVWGMEVLVSILGHWKGRLSTQDHADRTKHTYGLRLTSSYSTSAARITAP